MSTHTHSRDLILQQLDFVLYRIAMIERRRGIEIDRGRRRGIIDSRVRFSYIFIHRVLSQAMGFAFGAKEYRWLILRHPSRYAIPIN